MSTFFILFCTAIIAAAAVPDECSAGFYSVGPNRCEKCPPGTFQNRSGQNGCIPCSAGTVSDTEGAAFCAKCPPTTMPDRARMECTCPQGSILNAANRCQLCKPGTFYVNFGGQSSCQPCGRDTYQPLSGESECLDCPPGAFSDDGAAECTKCSAGQVFLGGRCGKCPAGATYLVSSRVCIQCGNGFFKSSVGQGPCIRCPPNGFSSEGSSSCTICPKGKALMANGKCGDCPAGKHYDQFTQTCKTCEPGTFTRQRNAFKTCTACAGDSYSFRGATKCIRCPPHKALLKNGSCASCPPGFSYNPTELKCEKCTINSVSDGGKMSFCFPCAEGSFAKPGSTVCYECGLGKVLLASTMKCGSCPSGRRYDQVTGTCS